MARRLVTRLTEDIGAKVLALFIAFLLWVVVTFLGSRTVIADEVPVTVVNLPSNLAVATDLKPVQVKFRAPRMLLRRRQSPELVRALIDLTGRGIGAQAAEVVVSPTDPQVDIIIVLPSRVEFTLDPIVQRSLPVKVVPEGTPAEGFKLGEADATPATVQARGALKKIQQAGAIEVRVPVGEVRATVEGEYPLSPPAGVTVTPERVSVKFEIVQTEETRTLGIRVITRGTPAAGHWVRTVTTDPPTVTISGLREILANLTFVETVAVDVDEARNPFERSVSLALPEDVRVVGGEPTVRVRVDIAPLEGTKEATAAVQVSDVGGGLRVTNMSPGSLRVTVRGDRSVLDALKEEDIRVVVSARERGAGAFSVRPSPENVRAPSDVGVVSVEGVDVSVTLESS